MVRGVTFAPVVLVVDMMLYRGLIWWFMWLLLGGSRCTRMRLSKGFGIKVKRLGLQKPHCDACCGI